MDTKKRNLKKRRLEQFDSSDEEGFEGQAIVLGTRRRKKVKDGVHRRSKSRNTSPGEPTFSRKSRLDTDPIGLESNTSCIDLETQAKSNIYEDDHNLASFVKKTYSSGMKNRYIKKDRSKSRTAHSSSHDSLPDHKRSSAAQLGKTLESESRDLQNIVNVTPDVQHCGKGRGGTVNDINPGDRGVLKCSDRGNEGHIDKVSKEETRMNETQSNLTNDLRKQSNSEYQEPNAGNRVAVGPYPTFLSGRNSNGFQTPNSNLPLNQVITNLEATASTITSLSTPIVTHQQLSNIADNGIKTGSRVLEVGSCEASDYANVAALTTATTYTNCTTSKQSDMTYSPINTGLEKNQNLQNAANRSNLDSSMHKRGVEQADKTSDAIPLVDLVDKPKSVSGREGGSTPRCSVLSNTSTLPEKRDTIQFSSGAGIGRHCQVTTSSLRVDNWGAYLLQRLEVLFDREQECDLTLKFTTGEILKVHRAVLSACTSLLPDTQAEEKMEEFTMPPELNYASVEPVVRFVYSGRLDVRGTHTEMSAIYNTALRLQVSLLTRLMDRRFPYLSPSKHSTNRLPVWRRTPDKKSKHPPVQQNGKGNTKGIGRLSNQSHAGPHNGRNKAASSDETNTDTADVQNSKDTSEEGNSGATEEEEAAGDGIYLLLTNSQKIAQANAAVRRKRPAEQARPTRFELEEELENSAASIATWSSKGSNVSPFFPSTATTQATDAAHGTTPTAAHGGVVFFPSTSSISVDTEESEQKYITVTAAEGISFSKVQSGVSTFNGKAPLGSQGLVLQVPVTTHSQILPKDSLTEVENISDVKVELDQDEVKTENMTDDEKGDELMEKISNICKQLEDGNSSDSDSQMDNSFDAYEEKADEAIFNLGEARDDIQAKPSNLEHMSSKKRCSEICTSTTQIKSILKKKKMNKKDLQVTKKHVSFPLDENNDLINEVAIYSHAKEPSHSLLDVQKTVGNFRSIEDLSSPVKLTLSLKKKVLVNLALGESEANESPSSHKDSKSRNTVDDSSQGQSSSQGVSQGDMSNHAKIISEVLKKYPHLVKDKKNIRLKILKKGNEKSSGGKLVKSKVQYLVLSENEAKGKTSGNTSKNYQVKGDNSSSRGGQNIQTFECCECEDASFNSYFTFKKHVQTQHKDKSSTILANVENQPYACYSCFMNAAPLEFADYCSYQQHMKEVHSKNETRVCNICGFRPVRKLELAYHLYTEHNKTPRNITFPKCDLCDHVAMNEAALLKHRSQHVNADNYTCSVCGVAFRSFGALQGHMQTKLCQNKPSVSHKCPYCPQTFARSYNLKAHCKSSHRSLLALAQTSAGSIGEQTVEQQEEGSVKTNNTVDPPERNMVEGNLTVEGMCETLTSISAQSSSEAEALSTVASGLAASLGLPEENMSQYIYTQGSKLDFQGNLEGERYEDGMNQPTSVSVHLIEAATPVSGYSGEMSACHDRSYTSPGQIPSTTSVGTLYPVSMVPSQIMPSSVVPGQIMPSHILPGNCVSVTGGSVLGATSHSWTYVTYQAPPSNDDMPSVITETGSLTPPTMHPNHSTSLEVSVSGKSPNSSSSMTTSCEEPNPLVLMSNAVPQVNISQGSHQTPQNYDSFTSQFV